MNEEIRRRKEKIFQAKPFPSGKGKMCFTAQMTSVGLIGKEQLLEEIKSTVCSGVHAVWEFDLK